MALLFVKNFELYLSGQVSGINPFATIIPFFWWFGFITFDAEPYKNMPDPWEDRAKISALAASLFLCHGYFGFDASNFEKENKLATDWETQNPCFSIQKWHFSLELLENILTHLYRFQRHYISFVTIKENIVLLPI